MLPEAGFTYPILKRRVSRLAELLADGVTHVFAVNSDGSFQ